MSFWTTKSGEEGY